MFKSCKKVYLYSIFLRIAIMAVIHYLEKNYGVETSNNEF